MKPIKINFQIRNGRLYFFFLVILHNLLNLQFSFTYIFCSLLNVEIRNKNDDMVGNRIKNI